MCNTPYLVHTQSASSPAFRTRREAASIASRSSACCAKKDDPTVQCQKPPSGRCWRRISSTTPATCQVSSSGFCPLRACTEILSTEVVACQVAAEAPVSSAQLASATRGSRPQSSRARWHSQQRYDRHSPRSVICSFELACHNICRTDTEGQEQLQCQCCTAVHGHQQGQCHNM